MTYSPLPPYLTIRPSEIHGLGLFATEDIPIGFDMGVTHIRAHGEWIRTPLGGFYNHSDEPNCASGTVQNGGALCRFIAPLRDIKAGEEITCRSTYSLGCYIDSSDGDDALKLSCLVVSAFLGFFLFFHGAYQMGQSDLIDLAKSKMEATQ